MRPIFRSENDPNMKQYVERMQLIQSQKSIPGDVNYSLEEELDDLEELIGDDEFASFINNEGELLIADTIYKYTQNGLYFVHEQDIDYLNDYLIEEGIAGISIQKRIPIDPCLDSGLQPIDDIITRYTIECDSDEDTIEDYDPYVPPTPPSTDDLAKQFLNNINTCTDRGKGLGRLFGMYVNCIDKFEDNKRIKVKYWRQKYLIYQSIGVKVKSQKKFAFWWKKTEADELRLGINHVSFHINFPNPELSAIPKVTHTYNELTFNVHGTEIGSASLNSIIWLPFTTEYKIEVNLPQFGINSLDPVKLNKFFQETAREYTLEFFRNRNLIPPKEITYVGLLPFQTVVYHTEMKKEYNSKKIDEIFDSQASISLILGFGSGGKFRVSFSDNFYSYSDIFIDVYGMGRNDRTWRGGRIVFNE